MKGVQSPDVVVKLEENQGQTVIPAEKKVKKEKKRQSRKRKKSVISGARHVCTSVCVDSAFVLYCEMSILTCQSRSQCVLNLWVSASSKVWSQHVCSVSHSLILSSKLV